MKQVSDGAYGGFHYPVFHGNHKGDIILPVRADDGKVSLDHIALLQIFPVETVKDFLLAAVKFLRETFHAQIRARDGSGTGSGRGKDPKRALVLLPLIEGDLNFRAGKVQRTVLIIEVSLKNFLYDIPHPRSPVSVSFWNNRIFLKFVLRMKVLL